MTRLVTFLEESFKISEEDFKNYNWIAKEASGDIILFADEPIPKSLPSGHLTGIFSPVAGQKVLKRNPMDDFYFRCWWNSPRKLKDVISEEGVVGKWEGIPTEKIKINSIVWNGVYLILDFNNQTFWYDVKDINNKNFSGNKFESITGAIKYYQKLRLNK